ncbi:hypothetical protein [uncultured Desulfovibrio sp.]|uniref:hypothetical protein n=1 Tax=uncultured Desulfovibrio sp. TaxID=167968 RepID=UPI002805754B|nr:hypothetical protein [uncultured Desulfovibrio sp.]
MLHNRTSIINTALMRIGAQGVTAGFQDSASAQTANAAYDRVVSHCLGLHPWSFALRYADLAPKADSGDGLYRYAYPLPAACLRVVDARCGARRISDWTIADGALFCDAAPVRLTFVSVEASAFPDAVADVIAWRLAFEIAPYAEQGGSNAQAYLELFERALDKARTLNDLELRPRRVLTSPFLQERRVD